MYPEVAGSCRKLLLQGHHSGLHQESEHRGKGRFQTINRFFFFLMSDLLASGKWQKVLLKRLLYGIVVLLGVAERSL